MYAHLDGEMTPPRQHWAITCVGKKIKCQNGLQSGEVFKGFDWNICLLTRQDMPNITLNVTLNVAGSADVWQKHMQPNGVAERVSTLGQPQSPLNHLAHLLVKHHIPVAN